jgi:hypothetical protein
MNARICEHCGQRFLSETIRDYIEFFAMLGLTLYAPFLEFGLFREGRWICGVLNLVGLIGLIYEMISRHKLKAGEVVKLGLECPSCGNQTVEMKSPLGEQLTDYWSSPETVDEQEVAEKPEIAPVIGGEDDRAVVRS